VDGHFDLLVGVVSDGDDKAIRVEIDGCVDECHLWFGPDSDEFMLGVDELCKEDVNLEPAWEWKTYHPSPVQLQSLPGQSRRVERYSSA
jgi:hypothetical protein